RRASRCQRRHVARADAAASVRAREARSARRGCARCVARTHEPGGDPRVSDLVRRDRDVVWHPYTQHGIEDEPLAVLSAHGAVLVLEDGREIVDGISSWWTCLHGHGRPEIVEAMRAQAETLDHVLFAGATHAPAVRLAERLIEAAPAGLARVFFSDNGSTA